MEVRLYHFNKRVNSTASPSKTSGTLYEGNVVDNCSMFKPRVRMYLATPTNFNYAYISVFDRFYHIRNWTWESPYWVAEMECDVLGSFKSVILATEQYVERAYDNNNASGVWNGDVLDSVYPATTAVTISTSSTTSPFKSYEYTADGYTHFVIGAITADATGQTNAGAASYYSMDWGEYTELIQKLANPGDWYTPSISTLDNINDSLWTALCNPMKYIISIKWFPFAISDITHSISSTVQLGTYPISDVVWYTLPGGYGSFEFEGSWSIPKHPKYSSRGNFLNSSEYSNYYLLVPPFGIISIPPDMLIEYSTLNYSIIVDLISGKGHLKLWVGSEDNVIVVQDAVVGQPTALAQTSLDYSKFTSSSFLAAEGVAFITEGITDIIGGVLSGGTLSELYTNVNNASHTFNNKASAAFSTISKDGSNGGDYADFYTDWKLIGVFRDIVDKDDTDLGRPVMKKLALSSLGEGYCKVYEPDFDFNTHTDDTAMTQDEVAEVNRFMVNGFFIK